MCFGPNSVIGGRVCSRYRLLALLLDAHTLIILTTTLCFSGSVLRFRSEGVGFPTNIWFRWMKWHSINSFDSSGSRSVVQGIDFFGNCCNKPCIANWKSLVDVVYAVNLQKNIISYNNSRQTCEQYS